MAYAHTDLPLDVTVIAGGGSGETLDRKEFLEPSARVDTGQYDLVLCEDLGRIVRRMHAHLFAEQCVDRETRLISINDVVDSVDARWQDRTILSAGHRRRGAEVDRSLERRLQLPPAAWLAGVRDPGGIGRPLCCFRSE
jgi:site-specific DNA recombinase